MFFEGEDGMRGWPECRGLGGVYKRQVKVGGVVEVMRGKELVE